MYLPSKLGAFWLHHNDERAATVGSVASHRWVGTNYHKALPFQNCFGTSKC